MAKKGAGKRKKVVLDEKAVGPVTKLSKESLEELQQEAEESTRQPETKDEK